MSDFANRITTQREILSIVNNISWQEELFGLSSKALERWAFNNGLDLDCSLVKLLKTASEKLFFLATKSQEQITEEYRMKSTEVIIIYNSIKQEINNNY